MGQKEQWGAALEPRTGRITIPGCTAEQEKENRPEKRWIQQNGKTKKEVQIALTTNIMGLI